jgi:hypothetical protein
MGGSREVVHNGRYSSHGLGGVTLDSRIPAILVSQASGRSNTQDAVCGSGEGRDPFVIFLGRGLLEANCLIIYLGEKSETVAQVI